MAAASTGTKFIVDFGGVKIPSKIAGELEGEMQRSALAALAKMDFRGRLRIGDLPAGIYGYTINPDQEPIPYGDGGGSEERGLVLFPAKLATSKASDVASIRVLRGKDDVRVEQLDARGQTIKGFVFRPLRDKRGNIASVEVSRIGGRGAAPGKLTADDRADLAKITDELSNFKSVELGDGCGGGSTGGTGVAYSWVGDFLKGLDVGIACGLAAVEGGANPVADVGCVAAVGAALDDKVEEED